ncbi:MAG: helicase-related protein, partial [Thermovirgaceae bacterium]|nr:helicase-related protein [Thermovirgaceae bacterium]
AWNVVPDTIASLLSYEAERKMLSGLRELPRYTELYKKRKPLLRFSVSQNVLSGMSTLTLLYPCVTLAEAVDPLKLALTLSDDGPASRELVRHHAREIIIEKLRGAGVTLDHIDGRGDQRWHWASLAILDGHYFPEARRWSGRQDGLYRILDGGGDKEDGGGFSQHVAQFVKDIKPSDLGPMPNDLMDVLVELALAGPAVCAHRGLMRKIPGCSKDNFDLLRASGRIADGFRTLFNLPETIGLLREDEETFPHWRRALQHGIEGNLQAVMDEYVHNLFESLGLSGHEGDYEKVFGELAEEICTALSLRTARIDMEEMGFKDHGRAIDPRRVGMRTRFALRFGEIRDDSGERLARAGVVRQSFNSPFRPFVLATTSVGQEGLDFHPYCHVVYHWNLPSNPVDMEQREGRVHRYKGHAVRKNIALKYGLDTVRQHYRGKGDPWDILFKIAVKERDKGASDLIPYWIFELEEGYKVERRVPIYPLSREESYYKHLKQSLALYRLVFGQPRQEDLLAHLERRVVGGEKDLDKWRISLAPPGS